MLQDMTLKLVLTDKAKNKIITRQRTYKIITIKNKNCRTGLTLSEKYLISGLVGHSFNAICGMTVSFIFEFGYDFKLCIFRA